MGDSLDSLACSLLRILLLSSLQPFLDRLESPSSTSFGWKPWLLQCWLSCLVWSGCSSIHGSGGMLSIHYIAAVARRKLGGSLLFAHVHLVGRDTSNHTSLVSWITFPVLQCYLYLYLQKYFMVRYSIFDPSCPMQVVRTWEWRARQCCSTDDNNHSCLLVSLLYSNLYWSCSRQCRSSNNLYWILVGCLCSSPVAFGNGAIILVSFESTRRHWSSLVSGIQNDWIPS